MIFRTRPGTVHYRRTVIPQTALFGPQRRRFGGEREGQVISQDLRPQERNAMIKIKRLGYALLLLGIATGIGYSQETASDYVAPSEAVPKGKAPRMQVQFLTLGEHTR